MAAIEGVRERGLSDRVTVRWSVELEVRWERGDETRDETRSESVKGREPTARDRLVLVSLEKRVLARAPVAPPPPALGPATPEPPRPTPTHADPPFVSFSYLHWCTLRSMWMLREEFLPSWQRLPTCQSRPSRSKSSPSASVPGVTSEREVPPRAKSTAAPKKNPQQDMFG